MSTTRKQERKRLYHTDLLCKCGHKVKYYKYIELIRYTYANHSLKQLIPMKNVFYCKHCGRAYSAKERTNKTNEKNKN